MNPKEAPSASSIRVGGGSTGGELIDTYTLSVVENRKVGVSLEIDPLEPVLVGTGTLCNLKLADPSLARRHCSFRVEGGQLLVTNLSASETIVNDVSVREAILRGGEKIKIGKSTVISVTRDRRRADRRLERSDADADMSFGRMLGESPVMRRLYATLARLASSDTPILVEGETGVGKHLFAEELHALGPRALRPFVGVQMNGMPADAQEERLFGKNGAVAKAAGGTLFIDEIASLSSLVQKLVILAFDLPDQPRFVFATSRNLDREVEKGRLDDEVLQRLLPGYVTIPPLRERLGDVEVLAHAFWAAHYEKEPIAGAADLLPDFMPRFDGYAWPGNVRELKEAVAARYGGERPFS